MFSQVSVSPLEGGVSASGSGGCAFLDTHPPGDTHPWTPHGQQAGGTHPTGMLVFM